MIKGVTKPFIAVIDESKQKSLQGWLPSTSELISYPPFTLSLQSATESDVKTKKLLISRAGVNICNI